MYSINYKVILIIAVGILFCISYRFKVKETFDNYKYKKNDNYKYKKKITWWIPCDPPNTSKLDQLMESVRDFKVDENEYARIMPEEIIIYHSGMTEKEGKELENKYQDLSIKVITTTKTQYAGDNKNMAAEKANGDYISFIDVDYVLVRYYFYYLKKDINIFYLNKALLHSYYDRNKISERYTSSQTLTGNEIYDFYQITDYPVSIDDKVSHGYLTIKKEVLKDVQFRKGKEFHGKENALFVRDLVRFNGRKRNTIVFFRSPLSTN